MALAIDSTDLFDLDARDEEYTERLFLQPVTATKVLVMREPTSSQLSGVSLTLSGKKGSPSAAIRNFLESVILTVEEVEEHVENNPDLQELLDEERVVDFDFLLDRLADPEYVFDEEALVKLVRHVMGRSTGFPTKSSSGSSTGQPTTGQNSPAASRRVGSTRSSSHPAAS